MCILCTHRQKEVLNDKTIKKKKKKSMKFLPYTQSFAVLQNTNAQI